METTNKTSISVETTVHAAVEKVWEYWSKPEHITKWYNASDDWHAPYADNDLHINGKFKTTMSAKDGSFSFDFEGIYTDVKQFQHIKYKISNGRNVEITFVSQGNSTKVIETFETEDIHPVEVQRAGWQNILGSFKKYVEKNN